MDQRGLRRAVRPTAAVPVRTSAIQRRLVQPIVVAAGPRRRAVHATVVDVARFRRATEVRIARVVAGGRRLDPVVVFTAEDGAAWLTQVLTGLDLVTETDSEPSAPAQ